MATISLKSGRDKSVRQRHPRLFSGALKTVDGKPKDGDVVDVVDNKGEWLARGVINQLSSTAVRLLSWQVDEAIDDAFWRRAVQAAVARRAADPLLASSNARRLIFSESDGLPGVIADDYAGHIVVEFSTLCALRARDAIIAALREATHPRQIVEQLDAERLRTEYGNNARLVQSLERGTAPNPARVLIDEHGLRFHVNLTGTQKTGFYLDQRENRARVARYCAGARVLNMFSFSGAFSVHASAAGAKHIVNVDSSRDALDLAAENAVTNVQTNISQEQADAFEQLRAYRDAGERFDVVILDPPKFAHHPGQIDKAARAYKDLNRLGLGLLAPGGVLATFSCSGVVDAALFQQIIFSAGLEAGRACQIVERLTQASDHPVLTSFPESEYLKGLIVRMTQ